MCFFLVNASPEELWPREDYWGARSEEGMQGTTFSPLGKAIHLQRGEHRCVIVCWQYHRSHGTLWVAREVAIYNIFAAREESALIRGKTFDLCRLLVKYLGKAADVAEMISFSRFAPFFFPWMRHFELKFDKQLMAVYWGGCQKLALNQSSSKVKDMHQHPCALLLKATS